VLLDLPSNERLRLMKFVCSFAWADLEIHPKERRYVAALIGRLELDAEERRLVAGWLEVPPSPDEIDPTSVPHEHRSLFLEAVVGIIEADGVIAEEERQNLALLESLLA
jgi:uncharacterized membrane protein YebE (DUF533 family)